MIPKIAILIIVLSLTACSEDSLIEQSTGTKLISVEYVDDDRSWIEQYSYSPNDELTKIEEFSPSGKRYELDYQDSLLKEYTTYRMDDGKLISRDSLIYNSNGTIQAIYSFSSYSEGNLSLSWIYEYDYDNENRVSNRSTYYVNNQKYTREEEYHWKGNNIEKVAHFTDEKELFYEAFYEYDDKKNYKKGVPKHIVDPINWSENNVTKTSYKDYLGLLDLACGPCIAEYKYNLDDYPVSIQLNWGREMKLTYE